MLEINMEDVVGVLQTCQKYLIPLLIALTAGIAVIIGVAVSRKLSREKKFVIRWNAVLAMVLAIVLAVNLICLGPMSNLISLTMGEAQVDADTTEKAAAIAEQVAAEGFVLLENEGLLPLTDTQNLNLFGWASINPLYGGAGSGGINALFDIVTMKQGLLNAGFSINEELEAFYNGYTGERPEMSIEKQSWTLPEPPVSAYSDALIDNAKAFSDVAVIVLARAAGEGHNDLPMDVSQVAFDHNSDEYLDFEAGEHYLQLSRSEENMVALVCENFDKVLVLYNGANPIEMGFVEEYPQIKAAIWCPGPGNVGFNALGKILRGEINPSGRTSDTFLYDMTKAPWWNNAAKVNYENLLDMTVDGMNAGRPQTYSPSFVNYVDGVYVGYKFYETAHDVGMEGFVYDQVVQYPFGYGLSYTTFSYEMGALTEENGRLTVPVTVTNTGDVAGKDVVGIYFNPPYTEGGIEKATANLIEFGKTGLLEPGASETLELSFAIEDMASYDYLKEEAYVLEKGNYIITARTNSHDIVGQAVYTQSKTMVYGESNPRTSDGIAATNLFMDVHGDVTYLSRADRFANFAEATAAPASLNMAQSDVSTYQLNANFDYDMYIDPNDEMPVTGADNGLILAALRGADYDDPRWEQLLDQLSIADMVYMTSLSGYQTPAVESVGKVQANDADGPAAINNNFTGAGSIGFPVATVIACTWNQELAHEYGSVMGEMAREMDVAGWYAPGINMHRYPFGGRNYEYYSEDSVLTGRMAGNAVAGAEEHGVYSYIKHFAMYDGNYKMVSIWSNEQAIREIYLKPFEICVKEFGADGVMASWSFLGTTWAGECGQLLNTVLRDEWGFRGTVVSDFFRNNGHGFMNADAALANGMDAMLATYGEGPNRPHDWENPSASTVKYLRTGCKNIMYTLVNSWEYEDATQNSGAPAWKMAIVVVDVLLALALIGAEILILRKSRKMTAAEKK
ncbi:MAG: glycoside hydrolase family 3 C-terminal domain-containing protein [Oscillospiraceae bacterium]|nr:glycoside hydrolase family 3 C-terminal domain-containing protein [Oscillospiraceae bacterium]